MPNIETAVLIEPLCVGPPIRKLISIDFCRFGVSSNLLQTLSANEPISRSESADFKTVLADSITTMNANNQFARRVVIFAEAFRSDVVEGTVRSTSRNRISNCPH